jgi:hypothetical protein
MTEMTDHAAITERPPSIGLADTLRDAGARAGA